MSEPDIRQTLYGRYMEGEAWRQGLAKRMAHKALDIPVDDEMIVDNSRTGLGWKELAVVVGGLLGAGGIATAAVTMLDDAKPAVVSPAEPAEGSARVRVFWGDKEILPGQSEETTINESQ